MSLSRVFRLGLLACAMGAVALAPGVATAQKSAEKPAAAQPLAKPAKATADQAAKPRAAKSRKRPTRKASSPCQGLAKTACGQAAQCSWVQPTKAKDTRGRELKAYCRKRGGFAKKSG